MKPDNRAWRCALDPAALSDIQRGVLQTRYRGRLFLKSPFDIVLYMQLIQRLRPRTVIEIGTKEGGSALWFADMLHLHQLDGRVVSVDQDETPALEDQRITFIRGDARHLADCLSSKLLGSLMRPWLVIEDSAHLYETTIEVLEFFHRLLESGDYIAVEDGIVQFFRESIYKKYENGPNRAVAAFIERHPNEYTIDASLCDYFGYNVTYNTNGFLRRA
jgi:cephalosporin hydroxylase